MKRKIAIVLLVFFVISFLLITFTACGNKDKNDDITDVGGSENPDNSGDSGNTNNGGNNEQSRCVPVYQGMTITNSNTTISLTSANYRSVGIMLLSANNENNGNHYGHYKGDHADRDNVVDNDNPYPDNSDSENIEEEIKSSLNVVGATNEIYYATSNQDIYINIHIYNPDNFEIMSFTLNGKKYSSYMFEEGSDMETIVLKYNVGAASGIVEYTIDAIKYIDGTEIKDVIIDGEKTVKAGIKTANQLTTSISGVDIDTNALSFNANIVDKDNLITFSSGTLKAVIYDGAEIVAQQDLTVGENSITFANLKTNTLYQYAIVGYYDDLSGDGFKMNVIYKDAFYTDAVVLFDNITVGQESINFGYLWHEDHQGKAISSLKLYKDNNLVKDITPNSTTVNELLSNTIYKLVAEYPNAGKTESIYLEFTTLAKSEPEISIVNLSNTQTSISFEINTIDANNIGAITKIELLHASGTIVADSIDQRAFTNLLSNNSYTVRVTYVYDLNDGNGAQTVTAEAVIKTLSKTAPSVTINKIHNESNWVYIDVSRGDSDNTITRIEASILLNGEVVKVQAIDSSCTIENLLYSTSYTVCITTYYDLNDGKGEHSKTSNASFTTSNCVDEQGISYKTYSDGTAEVVSFSAGVTELTIPESIGGYTVTSIADYVFRESDIVSIVIPSSVQKIGVCAFEDCYYLENVELNEGLLEIGAYAFEDCRIERFVIPLSVSKVGYLALNVSGCETWGYHDPADSNIYIKANTKPVGWDETVMCTRCYRPFWGFRGFVEQDGMIFALSNNKIAEVVSVTQKTLNTTIPDVVNGCTVIGIAPRAFDIYSWNSYYDHTKYNIEFPNKLEYIDRFAFVGIQTQQIILPETLEFIGYQAFFLADIEHLSINSKYIEIVSYAFERCNEDLQKTMTVNISLNAQGCINEYAFTDCDHIEFLNIPPSLTLQDNAFYECDIIKFCCLADRRPSSWGDEWEDGIPVYWSSYVDEQGVVYKLNSSIYVDGNPTFTVTDCISKNVSRVFISDKLLGRIVYMIGEEAFWDTDVSSIYIPKSVEVIAERAWDTDAYAYYQVGSKFWTSYGGFYIQDGIVYDDIYSKEYCVFKTLFEAYRYELLEDTYVNGSWYDFYLQEVDSAYHDVEIPSHFDGIPVTKISDNAFSNCYSLTSVIIPEGVTSIGDSAFYNCYNLTSVVIPNTVTNIGDYAFYGCTALVDVIIPDNITSITKNTFAGCKKLICVEDSVYYVDKWCIGCDYNISSINIKTGTVGVVDDAFINYGNLTSVIIPDSVTSIGDFAFDGCSSLKSVTIPNSVETLGEYAFRGCTSLTSVEFAENSKLTSIGDLAFSDCSSLTSVTIPNSVITIGQSAFYNCNKLTDVVLGNSVKEIYCYAFEGCEKLTNITIPKSVSFIGGGAFRNCYSLIKECDDVYYVDSWCVGVSDTISSLVIKDGTVGIAEDVLSGTNVTQVLIPDSVIYISPRAFEDCKNLTNITIGNGVASIGDSAFSGCSSLTSVTIPDSVTSIGDYAFYNCNNLTSVTIPDSVTSIGEWAFSSCTSLTSVTIPDSVTSIGDYAFSDCTGLTEIIIPYGITSIRSGMFSYCINLTNVIIPDTVTSIGDGAFYNCKNLTSITIPEGVTYIGASAFCFCENITNVTIPNSVTIIGANAFQSCIKLKSATIGNNVVEIGHNAFSNCSALIKINYRGTYSEWYNISKGSLWDYQTGSYTITCNYTGE